jgi:hypothetical protein
VKNPKLIKIIGKFKEITPPYVCENVYAYVYPCVCAYAYVWPYVCAYVYVYAVEKLLKIGTVSLQLLSIH